MKDIVLVTKHNKAKWIGPALKHANFNVMEYSGFDTDSLGSFCGSKPRTLNANQAAFKKARIACEHTSSRYGLGSEGSFTQHLVPGLMWDQEILCFYDAKEEMEFYALAEGPVSVASITVNNKNDVANHLGKHSEQKWMYKNLNEVWIKGLSIADIAKLHHEQQLSFPETYVPDFRAMHCPERQKIIRQAAQVLSTKLNSKCPSCGNYNFVYEKPDIGLPCQACTIPTELPKGWWAECKKCHHKDYKENNTSVADPTFCHFCNP